MDLDEMHTAAGPYVYTFFHSPAGAEHWLARLKMEMGVVDNSNCKCWRVRPMVRDWHRHQLARSKGEVMKLRKWVIEQQYIYAHWAIQPINCLTNKQNLHIHGRLHFFIGVHDLWFSLVTLYPGICGSIHFNVI